MSSIYTQVNGSKLASNCGTWALSDTLVTTLIAEIDFCCEILCRNPRVYLRLVCVACLVIRKLKGLSGSDPVTMGHVWLTDNLSGWFIAWESRLWYCTMYQIGEIGYTCQGLKIQNCASLWNMRNKQVTGTTEEGYVHPVLWQNNYGALQKLH